MKKLVLGLSVLSSLGFMGVVGPSALADDTTSILPITGQASGNNFKGNIDITIDGQHIKWTEADQKAANDAFAKIKARLGSISGSGTQTASANAASPMAGLTPPPTSDVQIGTGLYSSSDYIQDSSESKTGSDRYLVLENAAGNTCGPIAAHNLLTHFGNALNYTQLGPEVGYDGSQTGWGPKYAQGINQNESSYAYTAISTGYSSTSSAWTTAWDSLVSDAGVVAVPVVMDTSGQLPEFDHSLAHYWVAFGYSGNDNNGMDQPASQYMHYFDSSEEHLGTYWYNQYPMTRFVGTVSTIGVTS